MQAYVNLHKTATLTIKTPEDVLFSLILCGPVTRCLAWAMDLACVAVVSMAMGKLVGLISVISTDVARAAMILSYFIASIGYGIALEWLWNGQTVGKRLLGLRVVDVHGFRLEFSQVVIRNLLRFVDSLPIFYLVGGAMTLFSSKLQRFGDLAANTIVIRYPRMEEPDLNQLLKEKYNSFKRYPHLEARLRQRVSPEEADIALQALLRREQLSPQSRVELFQDLAAHFKSVVKFPQEASDGISHEQYVRNVVDALFSWKGVSEPV
jgi:uncharacterized RDD family membrane protein YckC